MMEMIRCQLSTHGMRELVLDCHEQFLSFHLVWHDSVVRSTADVITDASVSLFDACQRLLHELYRRDNQVHFLPADGWCLPAACTYFLKVNQQNDEQLVVDLWISWMYVRGRAKRRCGTVATALYC
jgi:hypothetical protein